MSAIRKRFYKEAAVGSSDGGFCVLLDGRKVKTPKGHDFILPSRPLAQAVAREWAAQGDQIEPPTMPMMQLAATAIDRIGAERAAILAELFGYCETDLLCYRAAHPADLVKRQAEAWQPVLDWAALHLDVPLTTTDGLLPITQPAPSQAALRAHLERQDDWRLAALSVTVAATGSLLLGLALAQGFIDGEAVVAASQLDERHQQNLWGEDEEAAERLAALAGDILAAERLLSLIQPV
ncbi:MAG: ATP12 family chaperone protein [Rhodospirillales bacterium]|nr:ATP12 family chaperone protein [Rhodospirillales bacterium]